MFFANTLAFVLWFTLMTSLCLVKLLKIMSNTLETYCKLLETSDFMLTWKNALLVLISLFSWALLSHLRVFKWMKLKLMLLKIGHNQPICFKCVVYFGLAGFYRRF